MDYKQLYPNVANEIEGEWDEKVVNIEYLTKYLVQCIQDGLKDGIFIDLEEIRKNDAAVAAILYALEPDCINGTSHRGSWFHATKKQLSQLNSDLVKAYSLDKFQNDVRERLRKEN